jgi:hypothetical protein
MDTPRDLQPYKNKLMELDYNEKMVISEWLRTEIDFERGQAVKEKMKQISEQTDAFIHKAAAATKSGAQSLSDTFKKAFGTGSQDGK